MDAETLDHCLALCRAAGDFDLASTKGKFPVGIDYEIYPAAAMERLHEKAPLSAEDREHLTKYFYEHPDQFRIRWLEPKEAWRWSKDMFTVDYPRDYDFVQRIAGRFSGASFGLDEILGVLKNAQ